MDGKQIGKLIVWTSGVTIILDAIISLSKILGLKTIAEGIEHKEQLDFLTSRGCDYGQGYYFSKPIKFSEISKLVQDPTVS